MAKRICFVESSISFDGFSPTSRPLDPAARALAYLTGALAQRGHTVYVINKAEQPITCDGVRWLGWTEPPPEDPEIVVAVDDPALLAHVAKPAKRFLWVHGAPATLDAEPAKSTLAGWRPEIVFHSYAQRDRWPNPMGLFAQVISPAPGHSFVEENPIDVAEPPRALTVCHPLGGLERLVRLFAERVRPAVPNAELHVHSALLDRARWGGEVSDAVKPIHELCQAWASAGVTVHRPQPDPQMADLYRQARAFLHPSLPDETAAIALMEAQAAGCPAIAFTQSALAMERISDALTGRLCSSDDAFVGAAIELLSDASAHTRMSAACKEMRRGRTWAIAASEWEERFA
ncbi:MAG: glycosyltransferase family 4 protein [Tagaea sp.]